MNRVIRATKGKRDALTQEAEEARRIPPMSEFSLGGMGSCTARGVKAREGQPFIAHCARQCQTAATTTGFAPHE